MHKDALTFLRGHFNEVEDIFCCLIVLVEKNLTLDVLPEECEVYDS